ncbi:hypothetical protein PIB30_085070 [Stylosanthes scabra]|uniref:Lipase n=1 Tax=Stylosanthes scabra TaxID=79078 RepID=A0ABU6QT93_9FABA|nr:hypothetical protein [Stylosanthes scabra]
MANIIASLLLLVFLILFTSAQGRKTLHRDNELAPSPSINNNELTPSPSITPKPSGGYCKVMIQTQGYPCEEHKVTTEDGYILGMQRIPTGRSRKAADKPPVFLQHGVFVDTFMFIFNLPEESLAYVLADNGYDVWMANTRGTRRSRGHTTLTTNDKEYWDWTWEELANYDLPASLGYVYKHTGQKMHYIGHSLGTLMALTAFSQHKLLHMLRSGTMLSPIAHLNHIKTKISKIAAELFLGRTAYWLGLREFVPKAEVARKFVKGICKSIKPAVQCTDLLTGITGPNCCINSSRTDILLTYEPEVTSTKNLLHLSQMVRSGKVTMYDYGDENVEHYGQPNPPEYQLNKIPKGFPLMLAYGGQDYLSDVNDVHILLSELRDHDKDKLVVLYAPNYAHGDFVMGVSAQRIVYEPVMKFLADN